MQGLDACVCGASITVTEAPICDGRRWRRISGNTSWLAGYSDRVNPVAANEVERAARAALPPDVFAFVADAAGDGEAARRNETAFRERALVPRILRDVSDVDTGATLLGQRVSTPVGVAPLPRLNRVHADAERGVAKAAADVGSVYCAPTNASTALEDLADDRRRVWFQLYPHADANVTSHLAERAAAAGMGAIVVTADRAVPGGKASESKKSTRAADYPNFAHYGGDDIVAARYNPAFTWDELGALCQQSRLPVVLKGVLNRDDALFAVEHGCAAVWVSNHGGRQLDRVAATLDVLEEVATEVSTRAEVYLDGGVRRGADVFTALALGADAVFTGRPVAYALGVGGTNGVRQLLTALTSELRHVMALSGAACLADITRQMVRP